MRFNLVQNDLYKNATGKNVDDPVEVPISSEVKLKQEVMPKKSAPAKEPISIDPEARDEISNCIDSQMDGSTNYEWVSRLREVISFDLIDEISDEQIAQVAKDDGYEVYKCETFGYFSSPDILITDNLETTIKIYRREFDVDFNLDEFEDFFTGKNASELY